MTLVALLGRARADERRVEDHAEHEPTYGFGYRAATHHGWLGLEAMINPFRRVTFEVNIAPVRDVGARGVAVTPKVQLAVFAGRRSTSFVSLGGELARVSFGDVTALGWGVVGDVGYERRWGDLGVQASIGFRGRSERSGRDGMVTATQPATLAPMASFALRYWFR